MRKIYILFLFLILTINCTNMNYNNSNVFLAKRNNNFGVSISEKGIYNEAKWRFKKALEYDTGNPVIYNNLAVMYEYFHKRDLADTYYRKALALTNNEMIKKNYEKFKDTGNN